jgi:hypothetical protein
VSGPSDQSKQSNANSANESVRDLEDALNGHKPAADWLDRVIGSMKDEPAFDEVLAHGRAIRQEQSELSA